MNDTHKLTVLVERVLAVTAACIAIAQAIIGDWAMGIAAALCLLLILLLGIRLRDRFLGLDSLVQDEIRKLHEAGRHRQVLRWGLSVSRALWVAGSYRARRTIGDLMVKSAERLGESAIDGHIKALIDDCGWTAIEMGDLDAGEKCILQGLELAKKHGRLPMVAKAMRHIAGKYLRSRNFAEAEKWIRSAKDATTAVPNGADKDELLAELHYARCVLCLAKGDLPKAEKEITVSETLYSRFPNKEWQAKIKIRIGEVNYLRGNVSGAVSHFGDAQVIATEHDFRRMIAKSGVWLTRCALKESNYDLADKYLLSVRSVVFGGEMGQEKADYAALCSELADARRRAKTHI